jgi:hypothetical protein
MLKKQILLGLTLVIMTLSLALTDGLAAGKQSPFLITGELPHLTKLLMKQWDNPALNLSEEQKTKLLVIRTETISGVRTLGPQVRALQKQVTDGITNGKTATELQPLVTQLAHLKAEATMLHLNCIYKTSAILQKQQLQLLIQK